MTQALHLYLTRVGEAALVNQLANPNQVLFLVGVANLMLKFVADVEVIFQGTLAASGNDRDLGKPCG